MNFFRWKQRKDEELDAEIQHHQTQNHFAAQLGASCQPHSKKFAADSNQAANPWIMSVNDKMAAPESYVLPQNIWMNCGTMIFQRIERNERL